MAIPSDSTSIMLEFEDDAEKTFTVTMPFAKSDAEDEDVQGMGAAFVTNKTIFQRQPKTFTKGAIVSVSVYDVDPA